MHRGPRMPRHPCMHRAEVPGSVRAGAVRTHGHLPRQQPPGPVRVSART